MQNSNTLKFTQVVITGGNSGLGLSFARHFAEQGKRVLIIGRNQDLLNKAQKQLLNNKSTANVSTFLCDLSRESEILSLASELRGFKNLEILINNAGYTVDGQFETTPFGLYQDLLSVHVLATTALTHAAISNLIANKGRIINIASIAAFIPSPAGPLYSSTKAFIVNFSQSIQASLISKGASCTVACPGFIRTNFHKKLGITKEEIYRRHGPFKAHDADWVAGKIIADARKRKALSIPGFNYRCIYAFLLIIPSRVKILVASKVKRARL